MTVQINETVDAEGPFLAGTILGYGTNTGDYIRILTREQAEEMQLALIKILEGWADA